MTAVAAHTRIPHDYYPTPAWCVHRLLEEVKLPGGHWCEPAAGEGHLIRAVREVREDVWWSAIEIRPECRKPLERLGATVQIGDALTRRWDYRPELVSVVITNPPFSLAEHFVAKALDTAATVALLLRLDFLGGGKRAAFFRRTPPDVHPLPNRPKFVHGRSDRWEYAWFVWRPHRDRKRGEVSVLATTPVSQRRPPRATPRFPLIQEARHAEP